MEHHIREGFYQLRDRYPNKEDYPYLGNHVAFEGHFRKIMQEANLVYKNASDQQLVKRILYAQIWGLEDHPDHPFSSVLMNQRENIFGEDNLYHRRLSVYIERKVLKFTGITFLEYLELPRHIQSEILSVCKKLCDEEDKITRKTNQEHDALMQEMKEMTG